MGVGTVHENNHSHGGQSFPTTTFFTLYKLAAMRHLKDACVWGRDKTSKCKIDLECNHQGCAEEDESHGRFGTIVSEVAPSLPSNIDLAKKRTFGMFNSNNGGKRKSRKGKRSKKNT